MRAPQYGLLVSTIGGEEQRIWSPSRKVKLFISVGGACSRHNYRGSKGQRLKNFMEASPVKHSRNTVKKKQRWKTSTCSTNT